MKNFRGMFLILGIVFHVVVTVGIQQEFARQRETKALSRMNSALSRAVFKTDDKSFARQVTRFFWNRLRKQPGPRPDLAKAANETMRAFSLREVLAVWLDDRDVPQAAFPAVSPLSEACLKQLDMKYARELGFQIPVIRQARPSKYPQVVATQLLAGDFRGKPGQLMVAIDVGRLPQRQLVFRNILQLRRQGFQVGWFDRSRNSGFPRISPPFIDQKDVSKFFNSPGDTLEKPGKKVLMLPFRENLIFWGSIPRSTAGFPPWSLFCLLVWVTVYFHHLRTAGKPRLADFLSTALGIAAGLPLILTGLFWIHFTQNRSEAIQSALFREMEKTVIDLDAAFPQTLRKIQNTLREATAQAGKTGINQAFIQTLMDQESRGAYESAWLVGPDGGHLIGFTVFDLNLKFFLQRPIGDRRAILQDFMDRGLVYSPQAMNLFLRFQPGVSSMSMVWDYRQDNPEKKEKILQGMSVIGKTFLDKLRQDSSSGPGGEGNGSALALGAVIDSQIGDLIQMGFASRGNFLTFSAGGLDKLNVFTDIIKDPKDGSGRACLISTNDQRFCDFYFLKSFFQRYPEFFQGWKFAAESSYSLNVFPDSMKKRLFSDWAHKLAPPKTLLSKACFINDRKVLVSAYQGPNLPNSILVAIRSWRQVAARQRDLLLKMLGIAVLFSLIIGSIFWNLYKTMVPPAIALTEGARAMENKLFEHRIPLSTGDEWDELARAFNAALQNMSELGVARQVQRCLLAEHPHLLPFAEFYGHNFMTSEVGGDYYDSFVCRDGGLLVVIGDVTGHGLGAALAVGMAKSACQILVRQGSHSPEVLLTELNRLILRSLGGQLRMTFQAFHLKEDGTLLYANAGHPSPYLISTGGAVTELVNIATPLGLKTKRTFSNLAVHLKSGEALFLYTDGLIEQENQRGEAFFDRFSPVLERRPLPVIPTRLVAFFQSELETFSGSTAWNDDVTLAVLKYHAPKETPKQTGWTGSTGS